MFNRYGDKCPKSILARLFAVGWILIGITLCSMFTASLTTAITTSTTYVPRAIKGKMVNIYI